MLIHDLHQIGERCYAIRKRYGWTQLEAAIAADVSERTYSELERGTTSVRVDTILKVCRGFHITPDEVLTDHAPQASAREADILARLQSCSPRDKETALQLLDTYLRSLHD